MNELILLEEEQARRALEEERMRMEEHARQREQMIGGPPRGTRELCVCVLVRVSVNRVSHAVKERDKNTYHSAVPGKTELENRCYRK